MKANIPKNPTRRERELELEKREMVKRTLEVALLAVTFVYGDHGYGTKRIDERLKEIVEKINYFVDRYGDDCAVFAMRKKAKELYDIEVVI